MKEVGIVASKLKIGILGGTFDPPHLAHIHLAKAAHEQLKLNRVFFVPAADPPHKLGKTRASVSQRLEMLKQALIYTPEFEISLVDVERPGPHYSVDTAHAFKDIFEDAHLYFIMGTDALADLPNWLRPNEILKLCMVAVMKRPGFDYSSIINGGLLPELADRCVLLEGPELAISSSSLLIGLHQGKDVTNMLAPGVLEYIKREKIYNF